MYRRTAFLFEYCVLILAILLLGLCLVYLQCFAVSIFRESVRVFHSDHICLTSFVYFFHLKIVPEKEKELLESNFNLPAIVAPEQQGGLMRHRKDLSDAVTRTRRDWIWTGLLVLL